MKTIKLFNLQNWHYYAIGEPYNFVREGENLWFIGLHWRIEMIRRMNDNQIEVEGVYSEDTYKSLVANQASPCLKQLELNKLIDCLP